jgi:hypothetical protein
MPPRIDSLQTFDRTLRTTYTTSIMSRITLTISLLLVIVAPAMAQQPRRRAQAQPRPAPRREPLVIPDVPRDQLICFCLYTTQNRIL